MVRDIFHLQLNLLLYVVKEFSKITLADIYVWFFQAYPGFYVYSNSS